MLLSLPLQCYKSSKDHSPQLDVNLVGSSVVHKEKQVRKKEHKLKITPMNADVIVLGLQSKDQAEQWLRVRPAGPPGTPGGCGGLLELWLLALSKGSTAEHPQGLMWPQWWHRSHRDAVLSTCLGSPTACTDWAVDAIHWPSRQKPPWA